MYLRIHRVLETVYELGDYIEFALGREIDMFIALLIKHILYNFSKFVYFL